MKTDLHFHSKLSDGRITSREIIEIALKKKAEFIACTEHDIINVDFPILAKEQGIESLEGVEISGTDLRYGQHLHLTCYSKKFTDEIHDILKTSRQGRQIKMCKQIDLLKTHGFYIDKKNFEEFFEIRGVNLDNFNSSHLSNYIYMFPENVELVEKLTGEKLESGDFIKHCLKDEGEYHWVGAVKIPEYEPSLEKCGVLAQENKAVLSLAHPNFKLTQEEFRERIAYYMDCGINAIEINAKATKSWVELILEYKERYQYILTFGSDCHFKKNDDEEHGDFLKMNSYVSQDMIDLNLYYLQKKAGLLKNLSIPALLGGDLGTDILEYARNLKEISL